MTPATALATTALTPPGDRHGIGGNNPPSPIAFALASTSALSDWMKDHPVIDSEDAARQGKLLVDRAKASLDEMERERDGLVRPLNQQVAAINGRYKPPRTALEKVLGELRTRLSTYAAAVEAERQRAADAARAAALAAEEAARAAEAREQEARDNAALGELDVDIAAVTQEADAAFAAFQKADRAFTRAVRDTPVRIAGGFGRALGLRNHEVLTVSDWKAAIEEMGLTDAIRDAIITSARTYRKAFGELPDGIAVETQRSL